MTKGPIPKRSEERIRRNKPEVEITKIETEGTVPVPPLDIDDPHPMIEDFYAGSRRLAGAGSSRVDR